MYGAVIRELRESRGLSQGQLAEIVGIARSNLSAYEHDRRLPSIDVFNRIAVACGYLVRAEAGARHLNLPLPKAGWFPDEDLPARLPDDPGESGPAMSHDAPMVDRVEAIHRVLQLAAAQRT